MIQVEKLTKKFSGRTVLNGISFNVAKGEILGFLGPNGAGKTTTMRILTGYMPPSSGRILIDGLDVQTSPREVKRRIGYLPELPPLYGEMTVEAYLSFVASLRGVARLKRRSSVGSAIERCNLKDVRTRLLANLSRGFRQRVGLAQALVHEPEILVLDEPTSGLDPKQIIEIRELVRDLAGEKTVVLSTHILPEVTLMCRKVVIIHEGRLVAVDSIDGLQRKITTAASIRVVVARREDEFRQSVGKLPSVDRVASGDGRETRVEGRQMEALSEEVSRLAVEGGYGLESLVPVKPGLEEIFLRLTGSKGIES